MKNVLIREINTSESGILEDMLYEAVYQPDTTNLLSRDIIKVPEINVYIKDFGTKKDDYCLVADTDNKIVGAVWIRILADEIKGYGNIDRDTPEFAISLLPQYRNRGIGTLLMQRMIKYMKAKGYKQTSLSVNKDNYAARMYLKLGFEIVKENEEDYLMVLNLRK